jgi:hypothetical protein
MAKTQDKAPTKAKAPTKLEAMQYGLSFLAGPTLEGDLAVYAYNDLCMDLTVDQVLQLNTFVELVIPKKGGRRGR